MKTCLRRWVIPMVALTLSTRAAEPIVGQDAILDEGFEQAPSMGLPVGWTAGDRTLNENSIEIDVSAGHSGSHSIKFTCAAPDRLEAGSGLVQLKVGRPYRLSGWIRTAQAISDPLARYPTALPACMTMESFPFTNHSPAVGGNSDWSRVETIFIATRAADRVRLHLGFNGTVTGTAWFDDIRLEEVNDIAAVVPMETLRWHKEGYRFDDRGWIFVHVEGAPYERGYQYGALLADEIVQFISKLAVSKNSAEPAAGWKTLRFETDALFLRGYDEEYLTEMKGIADGAASAEAKYDGRPVDLLDIVTINSSIDLDQLPGALEVTPHALTGENFLAAEDEFQISEQSHKCSAFAATGPATADGQIVFGQIFMWSGYTGVHWNVICDIAPSQGHRVVYQTFPGGIHSGADFYINSAGIMIGETTVAQTPYEPRSTPQSNRIRKAAQYASSIDEVERLLWEGNNGMYTNDWPIADIKTNEAAILLLGTHRKKMWRTGVDMNPFGTPGFLWSNNNNRDDEVRKEYAAFADGRPFDLPFGPWNRDVAFHDFYQQFKGRLDSNWAVKMWASSPINRAHACDGKITTTEMAKEMVFLAHYGKVTLREKFPQKDQRIMPDLPNAIPHLSLGYSVASPIHLTSMLNEAREASRWQEKEDAEEPELEAGDLKKDFEFKRSELWTRTIYPASDAENWFASGTSAYWKLLSELDPASTKPDAKLPEPAQRLGNELAVLSRRLLYVLSREPDLAAVQATRAYDRYAPYQIPRIKGTFALHQLRLMMGNEPFLEFMRNLHEQFSGKPMTNDQFYADLERVAGSTAVDLVRQWTQQEGLPDVHPQMAVEPKDGKWEVRVRSTQSGKPYRLFSHILVENGEEKLVRKIELEGSEDEALFTFDAEPTKVEFNPWNDFPAPNSNYYVWQNLFDDFDDMLIVYGTGRQIEANHTLARRWQETVANAYTEILIPLIKDAELSAEDAENRDLMVMGTLNDNKWFTALDTQLPVRFGQNHFEWDGELYGAPDEGLMFVAPNPLNPRRVMYVIAANSALQLHQMTKQYNRDLPSWAIFKSDKAVKKGFFPPEGFERQFAKSTEPPG